jgi:DNA modification methylase
LRNLPAASVDLILTDPPYFIDGMGDDWDREALDARVRRGKGNSTVGSLPVGQKFDPAQGRRFQAFMTEISDVALRILKPGGFMVSFSQARLYHRMTVALEDAGFEIRDMLAWRRGGQPKAFAMDHLVGRMGLSEAERHVVLSLLGGRKTPQLAPDFEPMALAQKPKEGTFVQNWLAHSVGLVDTTQTLDGRFPGTIMAVPKPGKGEKGDFNSHISVKPVRLLEHIIKLLTVPGAMVVDPFMGSGSTAVAAMRTGRRCVGFELDRAYLEIARRRIAEQLDAKDGTAP